MQKLDCKFEIKALEEAKGEFTGWASIYDNVDLGGDIVREGAFTNTLKANGGEVPLLWSHRTDIPPIGNARLEEQAKGLLVHRKLRLAGALASEVFELMKPEEPFKRAPIRGLSFGYDTIKHSWENEGGGSSRKPARTYRVLQEVRLHEVSPVIFPLNQKAIIQSVKAGEIGVVPQRIICSKEIFPSLEAAELWCVKAAYKNTSVDERKEVYVFLQREEADFDENTLNTISLDRGVQAVVGQLKQRVFDEYATLSLGLEALRKEFQDFKSTLLTQGIVDDPELFQSISDLKRMRAGNDLSDPSDGDTNDPDREFRQSFDALLRDMRQVFERYSTNG